MTDPEKTACDNLQTAEGQLEIQMGATNDLGAAA
jgi:hypothetical protein